MLTVTWFYFDSVKPQETERDDARILLNTLNGGCIINSIMLWASFSVNNGSYANT